MSTLGNTVHTLWVLPVHESSLHNCIHRSHFSRYGFKLCPDAIVLRKFKQETCKTDAVTPNALICWDFRSTICQSPYNIYFLLTWPWLVLDDLSGWALFSSNTFKKCCMSQSDRVQSAVSGNVEVHLREWWSVSAFPSSHQGGSCCAAGAANHTHCIAWSEDEKTAAWTNSSEKKDSRLTAPYTVTLLFRITFANISSNQHLKNTGDMGSVSPIMQNKWFKWINHSNKLYLNISDSREWIYINLATHTTQSGRVQYKAVASYNHPMPSCPHFPRTQSP